MSFKAILILVALVGFTTLKGLEVVIDGVAKEYPKAKGLSV